LIDIIGLPPPEGYHLFLCLRLGYHLTYVYKTSYKKGRHDEYCSV